MNAQPQALFDLPSGTILGRYEILRKLANRGMAEVYLARMRGTAGFERLVAIKRILPTLADDPAFVGTFLEEARLAAALHHPNIGDVYEVDVHEGAPFFAMELIHGQDLRAIRRAAYERRERVPIALALSIVHGVASALNYAHDQTAPNGDYLGLVHRDVTTRNILVSYDGAIKLIDFGIARAASHGHHTQIGSVKGKIPYMSPEQCRGLPLDRRSDLFSLGVVMYELTVGRRPFRGDNDFAIMKQILHREAPRPIDILRGYPPALDAIVMKLLARWPDDRYHSAEDVLQALEAFLAEHRLWVSHKTLSRYMRTVFADAIAAWDFALEEDVTTPVAQPLSNGVGRLSATELPVAVFQGIARLSQEMPAVRLPTESASEIAEEPQPAGAAAAPEPMPNLKRSGRGYVIGFVALVGIGIGLYWANENRHITPLPPPPPPQVMRVQATVPVESNSDIDEIEILPTQPPPAPAIRAKHPGKHAH